jgi:ABC-type protease/lipase transport system fused ATPase/permease subunit
MHRNQVMVDVQAAATEAVADMDEDMEAEAVMDAATAAAAEDVVIKHSSSHRRHTILMQDSIKHLRHR